MFSVIYQNWSPSFLVLFKQNIDPTQVAGNSWTTSCSTQPQVSKIFLMVFPSQKASFLRQFRIVPIRNFPAHVLEHLSIVSKALMINEITTTFLHCHSLPIIHLILGIFFSFFLSCSFSFIQVSSGHAASIMWHSPVSLSTIVMSGLLGYSLSLICIQKSQSIFPQSFTSLLSTVCLYHQVTNENRYLLQIHRQYCFYVSILHSAARQQIISSLSPHSVCRDETLCFLTLLFMSFVLNAWSCIAINILCVSFFSVPVSSQFQVSWLPFSSAFLINSKCHCLSMKLFFLILTLLPSSFHLLEFLFDPRHIPYCSLSLLFTYFFMFSVSISSKSSRSIITPSSLPLDM